MERITKPIAQALQRVGFHAGETIQDGVFGDPYYSSPAGDFPLPTYGTVADWLEREKGIFITRDFPERWNGSKWVTIRILTRDEPLRQIVMHHAPAGREDADKLAIWQIIKSHLL